MTLERNGGTSWKSIVIARLENSVEDVRGRAKLDRLRQVVGSDFDNGRLVLHGASGDERTIESRGWD